MAPPSKHDLKVAIDELSRSGKEWDKQAAELKLISQGIEALKMTHTQWGLAAAVEGVYEQLRSGLESRLAEAAKEAENIGKALGHSAKVYQREEDAGVHAANEVW